MFFSIEEVEIVAVRVCTTVQKHADVLWAVSVEMVVYKSLQVSLRFLANAQILS